jgi:hypothetical protein
MTNQVRPIVQKLFTSGAVPILVYKNLNYSFIGNEFHAGFHVQLAGVKPQAGSADWLKRRLVSKMATVHLLGL